VRPVQGGALPALRRPGQVDILDIFWGILGGILMWYLLESVAGAGCSVWVVTEGWG
jgi:hypothetical protein